jgi:hypothetical protein
MSLAESKRSAAEPEPNRGTAILAVLGHGREKL